MSFWRKQKRPPPSQTLMLAAKPLRHPQVTERRLEDGSVELAIPLARSRLARWLTGGGDKPVIRKCQLDKLGVEVWRMMDGRTTVRQMIERFAADHQLNLREAEVAMLAYLRTLATRGIIRLAVEEKGEGKGDKSRL